MGDTIRFVASVASSPTLRLDLNDETVWACTNFDAPPPRVRRSMSANLLTPGGHVAATSHDFRTLTITLECITNSQDLGATELQKLARELDRHTNYLQYQPTGATKPVFFKTYRSDVSDILDMVAGKTFRTLTIEVLADPYALGLEETLVNAQTVNNDPAHATNPMHLALGTVLGDVPAPLRVVTTTNMTFDRPLLGVTAMEPGFTIGTRPIFWQAEAASTGTDSSVFADAAFSGGSVMRTTPGSTSTGVTRWTLTLTGIHPGNYLVFLRLRKTVSTDVWSVRMVQQTNVGFDATYPLLQAFDLDSSGAHWFNMGVHALPLGNADMPGTYTADVGLGFRAGRTSGTGSIDADALVLIPVSGRAFRDSRICITDCGNVFSGDDTVWDAENDLIYTFQPPDEVRPGGNPPATGALPWVHPGLTNYLWFMRHTGQWQVRNQTTSPLTVSDALGDATSISAYYNPRYLYVRPSAS